MEPVFNDTEKQSALEQSGKFEGDIMLTDEQMKNGIINPPRRWPNGEVPLFIDNVFRQKRNFDKYDASHVTSFEVPYDYDNIKHYGPYEFSRNGLRAIEPKNPNAKTGQRDGLSEKDFERIERKYNKSGFVRTSTSDDSSTLSETSPSYENSTLCENSTLFENTTLYENSTLYENATLYENSTLYENATLNETSTVYETSTFYETSTSDETTTTYDNSTSYETSTLPPFVTFISLVALDICTTLHIPHNQYTKCTAAARVIRGAYFS
jgi:hypothetical protein